MWLNIPRLRNIKVMIFTKFQNCACCEKYLKDNKHNSLHLARKYARIFFLKHDLFFEAHSLPRVTLWENCSLLGTDSVSSDDLWAYFCAKAFPWTSREQKSKICSPYRNELYIWLLITASFVVTSRSTEQDSEPFLESTHAIFLKYFSKCNYNI